jgi:alpha-methylacyl-CoA racemase
LDWDEAAAHPHNRARGTFHHAGAATLAGPAPRFSETTAQIKGPPPAPDADRAAVLTDWGIA